MGPATEEASGGPSRLDSERQANSVAIDQQTGESRDLWCQERRAWGMTALERLAAEQTRGSETPLVPLRIRALNGVRVYLKDESAHLTGSLKHRVARSLFIHALCNGDIGPETPIIEASSGSTAVSEAYFANLIGVPFIAVIPQNTSPAKIELIQRYGGRCEMVIDPATTTAAAERLAEQTHGYFMDQFTFAAQATNWRANNIGESIFEQMRHEPHPEPTWIVTGAGTGGTSTCIARYARYKGFSTKIAVVDPEGSAFYDGWRLNDTSVTTSTPSRIEGIGRTRVEPSFFPGLIDEVLRVPDAASIAAMRWCSDQLGRRVGGSTGTNIWGALALAHRMAAKGESGSIVSIICDVGTRYDHTYFSDSWLLQNNIDIAPYVEALARFEEAGVFPNA